MTGIRLKHSVEYQGNLPGPRADRSLCAIARHVAPLTKQEPTAAVSNVLSNKFELFGALSERDRQLLSEVTRHPRSYAAGTVLIDEGDRPADVKLVVEGVAYRSKVLESGRRQVFAFLLPGDLCDSHVFQLDMMDHNIVTLTDCMIVNIPSERIVAMMERPDIARAIWISTMVDEATLREWLVNLGQRDAEERTAHLFCELHMRMSSMGLVSDDSFRFPLTQALLGDTMGISNVHANRVLQSLKRKDLLHLKSGRVMIPDIVRLREFGGFESNYLHLKLRPQPAFN